MRPAARPPRPAPTVKPQPVKRWTPEQVAGMPVAHLPRVEFNAAAGEPAATRWAYGGVAGFFDPAAGKLVLTENTYKALKTLGRGPLTLTQAQSVWTFTHELGHAGGIGVEHEADVFAAEHYSQVAYLLGLRGRLPFVELGDFVRNYGPVYGPLSAAEWQSAIFPWQPGSRPRFAGP